MISAISRAGGLKTLIEQYPYARAEIQAKRDNDTFCNEPPKDYMNFMRSIVPGESDFPWTGMTLGLAINSIWYWCTDQVRYSYG